MVHCTNKKVSVSTETGEILEEVSSGVEGTPLGNTGFPVTSLDWLSGSVKEDGGRDLLKEIFGADGWEEQSNGTRNYYKRETRGNISILWEGVGVVKGVHFDLSGQGCRELEGREGFEGWPVVLARLIAAGAKISRADGAIDDRAGLLSMDVIKEKVQRWEVATHYRGASGMWSLSPNWSADGGQVAPSASETVYLGVRGGQSLVRFYDWQKKHGGEEAFVRCEIELRKKLAHRLCELVAIGKPMGELLCEVLTEKVEFKEPGNDSVRSRWETCAWWSAFVGAVKGLKLSVRPVEACLNRKLEWVKKYVAPTLALLEEEAEETGLVAGLIQAGAERLKAQGRKFERIRAAGWRKVGAALAVNPDPFADPVREIVDKIVFDRRAYGIAPHW